MDNGRMQIGVLMAVMEVNDEDIQVIG